MLIELYADIICPWCHIGLARLRRALACRPDLAPVLHWQSFQLNPDMPGAGLDRDVYLLRKFGSVAHGREVYRDIARTAAEDGLDLALDGLTLTPNSRDAHRLIRLTARRPEMADSFGMAGGRMIDALFDAYLRHGRDIGDRDELIRIAASCGLAAGETATFLESGAEGGAVRAAEREARRLGIQAIPCFVFDRRHAVIGAQPPESFEPLFTLAQDATLAGRACPAASS